MSDEKRQQRILETEERIWRLMEGMPFRFTDDPAELAQLEASYHEISRLAMSAAKDVQECRQDAATARPVLEPE